MVVLGLSVPSVGCWAAGTPCSCWSHVLATFPSTWTVESSCLSVQVEDNGRTIQGLRDFLASKQRISSGSDTSQKEHLPAVPG